MSEEQLAKLFLPFSQADASTTRKYGGTGLGLSICARLVDLLGGTMAVDTRQGAGSTFRIALPCRIPQNANAPKTSATISDSAENGQLAFEQALAEQDPPPCSGRILLAEDSLDNQRLIELLLRNAGFEVTIAGDGQTAIDRVRDADAAGMPFDLILMDMQMPVLDGYSAVRQLRRQGCELPIVALTAHAMAGDREKCLAAGCDAYMTKPLDHRALIALMRRWVGERQASVLQAVAGNHD